MSAIGTKRTCRVAPHMSAFGGKADIACSGALLVHGLEQADTGMILKYFRVAHVAAQRVHTLVA